jgi:hypothetical protein
MCKDSLQLKRILIGVCLLLLMMSNKLHCQVSIESLPSYLNISSAGTEFYITTIPYYYADFGMKHYKILNVVCDKVTEVTITNTADGTTRSIFTKPNEVTTIDLYELDKAYRYFSHEAEHPPERVFHDLSVRITSKSPIVASFSTIDNYNGDSYLVLPISSWGREYVINSFNSKHNKSGSVNVQSMVCIVAAFDNTRVFYTLVGDGNTETVGGQKIGETRQYTLNKGDVLPISSLGTTGTSMTGSLVLSSKPVGVVSGHQLVHLPTLEDNYNFVIEMELPVFTWGKEFHIPKNFSRRIGYVFQVVAKEPNTTIFINGEEVKNLGTKLQTTSAEWGEFNLDNIYWNNSIENIVVTADKPISITVYNQGSFVDSISQKPFQMTLSPITQYQKHIVFSPILLHFGNFTNWLNVIVPLDEDNKIPSDVEWGELVSDTIQWTPFTEKWGESVQTYYGTQNGKKYGITNITLNKIGMYQIRAKEPMMAYLYGQSTIESFGFPAFVGLKDVTKIDTIPPKFNFLVNNYVGEVTGLNGVGSPTIQDMPEDGDSRTNLGFVFERTEYTVNFEMTINEFVPGEERITTFQPSVIDKSKDAQIVITAIDRAGNDTTIVLTYKPINTSVKEELSSKFLKVTPSITNNEPISIEISKAGENLSIVSIDGRTIHTFENLSKVVGSETIHFETTSLPIGMYYVLYNVNGKQYQQSFVKMK